MSSSTTGNPSTGTLRGRAVSIGRPHHLFALPRVLLQRVGDSGPVRFQPMRRLPDRAGLPLSTGVLAGAQPIRVAAKRRAFLATEF